MDSIVKQSPGCGHSDACPDIPEFRRLKYFFGQMLSARDFQTEQAFFREKQKLHNRCLHGHGVVCGLLVEPVPIPKDCTEAEDEREKQLFQRLEELLARKATVAGGATQAPDGAASAALEGAARPAPGGAGMASGEAVAELDSEIETLRRALSEFYRCYCRDEPRTKVEIKCGLALDCEGNEIILRRPLPVDLLQWLSASDRQRVKQGAHTLYLSLCYCEQPVDPVRPVMSDACGAKPDCTYGKLQDSVRITVTVDPPPRDESCGTCCEPCAETCVLLAEIVGFCPGHPLREQQIRNEVRRPLGLYTPTTITGISWHTGHHYTQEEAKHLMGTRERGEHRSKGLEIRFSRPVLASTIRSGVVDVWVIEGGRGRRGQIYNKDVHIVDHPEHHVVDRIFVRDTTDETLEPGDRVLVTLRTDFILDECCRPVDGENVGGKVPTIHEYAERFGPREDHDLDDGHHHPHDEHHESHHDACVVPPLGFGPWTSGNGTPGGTFVSWFFIRERERERW